jgi:hypothetical protein
VADLLAKKGANLNTGYGGLDYEEIAHSYAGHDIVALLRQHRERSRKTKERTARAASVRKSTAKTGTAQPPATKAHTRRVSPYQYTPLVVPRYIRLLRCHHFDAKSHSIFAILKVSPLNSLSTPTYHALSYTWGDPMKSLDPWDKADLGNDDADYNGGQDAILPASSLFIVDEAQVASRTLLRNTRRLPIQKNLSDFLTYLTRLQFRRKLAPEPDVDF